MSKVTIVNYHYIRDFKNSRFPGLKGCEVSTFKKHMQYLAKHYTPITMWDMVQYIRGLTNKLPHNAAMVTFDDGYLEHFTTAMPILDYYGIKGNFYVCSKVSGAEVNHELLDVNKIHILLATQPIDELLMQLQIAFLRGKEFNYRGYNKLPSFEAYYNQFAQPGTYDNADTMFFKRMLQTALPVHLRKLILNGIFNSYFTKQQQAIITNEMYMNFYQLRVLLKNGHHIGGHSYDHPHLTDIDRDNLRHQSCYALLTAQLTNPTMQNIRLPLTFCYPYGSHNAQTKELLQYLEFDLAFGVQARITDLATDDHFNLPRLDCNDFDKIVNNNH